MSPDEFVSFFRDQRASAILRTQVAAAVGGAMEAAVRGGFRVIEFTMNTPDALRWIGEFAGRADIVVGAGTVIEVEQAQAAVASGAKFLVSPVVDEAVIEEAKSLGVAMMPGTSTPTEMLRAHRAGAQLQKLFPGVADGPTYIRQTLGPLPFLNIVPTAGVDATNVAAYLQAGAHAVGFVSSLFTQDDMEAGRFDVIEDRARMLLKAALADG